MGQERIGVFPFDADRPPLFQHPEIQLADTSLPVFVQLNAILSKPRHEI